jgi:hypothetical protein
MTGSGRRFELIFMSLQFFTDNPSPAAIESPEFHPRRNRMHIRKMALILGMALALPCLAQDAPGGAPAGGSGGGAPSGGTMNMTTLKVDGFFGEVDTNKDGKITKEEWTAAGLKDMVFSMVNTSKSGSITKQELEASKFPADMDSNKDGNLTVDKMKAFDKKVGGGGAAGGGGGGSAPSGGSAPAGGGPQQ